MIKIIFLDVDGVLNSQQYYKKNIKRIKENKKSNNDILDYLAEDIDPECINRLQHIVNKTNAKIVVSSTWRIYHYADLVLLLKRFGFTGEVIGKTPRGCHACFRGNEIYSWIETNKEIIGVTYYNYKNYVIIDDDSDMLLWQKENFVKTSNQFGLQDEEMYKAIEILNQEVLDGNN